MAHGWRTAVVIAVLTAGGAGCSEKGDAPPAPAPSDAGGGGPTTAITVVARDIALDLKVPEAPAGTIMFSYVNEGQLQHTLLVAGREKELALAVSKYGDVSKGSIQLPSGNYVLYCDIPGHRTAGMEARFAVQ